VAVAAPARVAHDPDLQRDLELIGQRWNPAILWALMPGPERFNRLLTGIPGISDRVLTERLRDLVAKGIVRRDVDTGPPIAVTYGLTERGLALRPVLEAVRAWRRAVAA
jgi:DNA-binding HxlR family transcriptional regulator